MIPSWSPAIWAYCLTHLDAEGYVKPLQQDIAVALGCHKDTVKLVFQQFRRQGLLVHVGQAWERVMGVTAEGNPLFEL